jgi:hypothetical protein
MVLRGSPLVGFQWSDRTKIPWNRQKKTLGLIR